MKQAIATTIISTVALTTEANFDTAFDKLGFKGSTLSSGRVVTKGQEEEALLKIFYLAGYFKPEKLWQDINHIPHLQNKKDVFISIIKSLQKAGGEQGNYSKFDAKTMGESLMNVPMSDNEWLDFLLYVAQNAFNRNVGQE